MVKRSLDIMISLLALTLLSPLMLIIAIILFFINCRPILFKQPRPGLNSQIFNMYKFRSMNDNKDANGNLLPDSARLTSFGKFIRNTSVDELPGLWSVLKGDMSIVGPRPLLVEYLPLYSHEQARRHQVKPGITGWAQVNGRNTLSWEKKFIFDIWYVDNQTVLLDLKIILMTIKKVFSQADIHASGEATMTKFKG